ncbi:MAG: EAL domain-containing protein [Alphaproteobacteria bacterium]|nr:EAL domain-containing protein [Alphaproteobacteria bacterium]
MLALAHFRSLVACASLLALLIAWNAGSAVADGAARLEVAIIHSHHQDYPSTRAQQEGFMGALRKAMPDRRLDFAVEYLDAERIPTTPEYRRIFENYFANKHLGDTPRLIYATGKEALDFLAAWSNPELVGVPIVFSGVVGEEWLTGLDRRRFAGVVERARVEENVALIRWLNPDWNRRLILLGDASAAQGAMRPGLEAALRNLSGVNAEILSSERLDRAVSLLRERPGAVVLLTTAGGFRDYAGELVPLDTALAALTAVGQPVYAIDESLVRAGVIGGHVVGGTNQGAAAAELGARMLRREAVEPLAESPTALVFDAETLDRMGLRLSEADRHEAILVNVPPHWIVRHQDRVVLLLLGLGLALVGAFAWVLRQNRLIARNARSVEAASRLADEYRRVVDETNIVSKTDTRGLITYVNDSFVNVMGYSRDELIGKPHNVVRDPDTPPGLYRDMWEAIGAGKSWRRVVKNRTKSGEAVFFDTTITAILNPDGSSREFIAVRTDVTQLIRQEDLIREQTTDPLTGLLNRVGLVQDLKARRSANLAIIDVNRFKEINEFVGLQRADRLLVAVAEAVRADSRFASYRVGGDVFALLAIEEGPEEEFVETVYALVARLGRDPFRLDGQDLHLTFTAGVATGAAEDVYTRADHALDRAKQEGRALVSHDGAVEQASLQNTLVLGGKLKSALASGRVVPWFQPIVDNRTGYTGKFEALARLVDEDGSLIPPNLFLPVAKKTRQYDAVTRAILDGTLAALESSGASVSINLSIDDLRNPDMVAYLEERLRQTQKHRQVILEITENEGIDNYDEVARFIQHIKSLGCLVAIDDFGTGYSNFTHLMRLDADYLKIDGSIIRNVVEDRNAQILVRTLVDFANRLNMQTIAEFVSSPEILATVTRLGVDYSQGFHLGKPESSLPAVIEAEPALFTSS